MSVSVLVIRGLSIAYCKLKQIVRNADLAVKIIPLAKYIHSDVIPHRLGQIGENMAKKQSIFEVASKFNSEEKCIKHLEHIRWPKGLECPHCQSKRIMTFTAEGKTGKERYLYECIACRYQYSVTVGTIFHDSHLPLIKWFLAIYMICSAKKGIPATQLQRELEIGSYKTAWYMAHRIRLAMHDDPHFCRKYSGIVEIDEAYIGGKGKGPGRPVLSNKIPVVGIKERTSGKIRLKAIQDASKRTFLIHSEER